MPIDNDNSDYEAKRAEQRRQLEKQQLKAQQERDPLRSFEAKLSTQASKEEATRESMKKTERELKEMLAEKGDFLQKVLGDKDAKSAADLAARAKRHEQEFAKQKGALKHDLAEKIDEKREERKKLEASHESETEDSQAAAESHKKVVEIESQDEGFGGQGFSGGDNSGDSAEGGFGSEAGGSGFSDADGAYQVGVASSERSGDFSQSSGSGTSAFSNEDLDAIVVAMQHNFLGNGQEIFAVQLANDFYDGLKIEASRTSSGIVVTFVCPNLLVRSQMSRQKDAILKRFAEKQIQVQEVRFR